MDIENVRNSVDAMLFLALALENNDYEAVEALQKKTANWLIGDDEFSSLSRLMGAVSCAIEAQIELAEEV